MKKVIVVGLIIILCIVLLLVIACVRPILPGSYAEIIYPAPGAVVPTEFSVLAVAAQWSFGVEVEPILFLGAPKRYVGMPPSMVELTVDGVAFARSGGGNHHVFRVTAAPGDHTLGLTTPYGHTEITVHVTDDPPVVFRPFDAVSEYPRSVDALAKALFDFIQTSPSVPLSGNTDAQRLQRIFLAGDGAFVVFGAMKEQHLSACEVRYVAPIGGNVTADDIGSAPALFSWDTTSHERPVKLTALTGGGDRLFLAVLDDTTLTVFSVLPDGSTDRSDFPLSGIAPGLAESISSSFSAAIVTRASRDVLYIGLDTYQMKEAPGHFDILVRGDTVKTVDLGGKNVDGITPTGDLITFYPASFVGPFDSALVGEKGPISGYLPLPDTDAAFAFTGGYVHLTDEFFPEYPRFEIGPLVPCIDCTKAYVPVHYGVAGDVAIGPDIIKTTLGGREEYFIMRQ
jgi:hypothetical protein